MNTFKLTTPNGIVIESTWDDIASTPKVTVAATKSLELPKAVAPVKAAKIEAPAKPSKKAPVTKAKASKVAKASKQPKVDSKALLAEIRSLKAAGKFSEAVALTPASWTQVIGEIQLAAERNGTQYNAAVSTKKATKRVAKKAKVAKAPKEPVAEVAALNMKADTGSAKPTELAPVVEKAVHAAASLRDELSDIGVADFVIDVLTGDISLKTTRVMYTTATEDEVLDLMEACRQEALLIEDAAERMEAAGLKVDVVNGLVELWKAFAAKLVKIADSMTVAA